MPYFIMDYKEIDILSKKGGRAIWLCEYQNQKAIAKIYNFEKITDITQPMKEAEILEKSSGFHKSIKIIQAFLNEKTKQYIILMEYCSNGTLKNYLKKMNSEGRSFTQAQIWTHCKEFIELLAYLQTKNICHRDIKPDNIFVTENEELKLADFGEGKLDSESKNTIRGTPSYLSPKLRELYLNNTELCKVDYDPFRSDPYSLGLVLLEMVTMNEFTSRPIETQINHIISMINHPTLKMIILNLMWIEDDSRSNFLELHEAIRFIEKKEKCCKCFKDLEGQIVNGCRKCDFFGHDTCMLEFFRDGLCILCNESMHLRNENEEVHHILNIPVRNLPLIFDSDNMDSIKSNLSKCFICFENDIKHSEKMCKICSMRFMNCANCGEIPHSCLCHDNNSDLRCICQEILDIHLGDLFYQCPNCGILCRVCFKSDTTKSHKQCARLLDTCRNINNYYLN